MSDLSLRCEECGHYFTLLASKKKPQKCEFCPAEYVYPYQINKNRLEESIDKSWEKNR